MLRRQALRGMRRPLVVMSPKSLLRHPLAVSSWMNWRTAPSCRPSVKSTSWIRKA
jgi:2-oxoglutarate dehydrogenase complex dehydrogenase (E1) component-like enzyme